MALRYLGESMIGNTQEKMGSHSGNAKFSILSYAHRKKTDQECSTAEVSITNPPKVYENLLNSDDNRIFKKWVEEIRSELVKAKGKDNREKQRYNDILNRAILGYEEERSKLLAMIHDLVAMRSLQHAPLDNHSYDNLSEAIFAEIIGLNVLELVMKNRDGLEEIQVAGCDIFEVRYGQVQASKYRLSSIRDLDRIQQNLVLFNNDSLSPRKKWAEVILQDGARVTMTGFGFTAEPTLTIRFYTIKRFDLQTLLHPDFATMDSKMLVLILSLIRSYFNLVIIGSTNSGKTNLIKAFVTEMKDEERIITIETRLELHLKRDFPQKNIVEYEVDEEEPRHSSKQAFKLALRQSPKRICHAEIRDEDANMYVRACTRGHEGSLTTLHAHALEDVPDTITDMCMLDGRGMDSARLRKRITEHVTQFGFQIALIQGKRRITRIGEFSYVNGEVKINDLALFNESTNTWVFPKQLSLQASSKIKKYDQSGYVQLQELGFIEMKESETVC